MTKQTIGTRLDVDWIDALAGKTIREAVGYLSQYDYDAGLGYSTDFDDQPYGYLYTEREETDEEYAARLAQEAEEERQREEDERKAQEQLTERMMLIADKDVAFAAYMEKHKDNPNIGDLSNLFMAAMSLGKERHGASVVGPMLECMERLEKEGETA